MYYNFNPFYFRLCQMGNLTNILPPKLHMDTTQTLMQGKGQGVLNRSSALSRKFLTKNPPNYTIEKYLKNLVTIH